MNPVDTRVLRALRSGPLYRPLLETVLGLSERQSEAAITRLLDKGLVEVAREIGPATYRITDAGLDSL